LGPRGSCCGYIYCVCDVRGVLSPFSDVMTHSSGPCPDARCGEEEEEEEEEEEDEEVEEEELSVGSGLDTCVGSSSPPCHV